MKVNNATVRRRKWDKHGVCVECGHTRDTKKKTCTPCLAYKQNKVTVRQQLKKQNGLCWICKDGIAVNGGRQCEICMLKNRCVVRMGSRSFWKKAKLIWDQQKGICPYTGRQMTLVEAEIDHILPTSRGGTHDPSNIQFVPAIINRMKSDSTDGEFLKLVEEIYNYRVKEKR